MATEYRSDARGSKLRKQSEIEEVEEQESSPGSDQSDATITADKECQQQHQQQAGAGSPESEDIKQYTPKEESPSSHGNQVHPKIKQLTRGIAVEDMSPPPEQSSLESGTNGIYYKTNKTYLEKSGSQSSEASLSRDSSLDKGTYKDSTGINLEDFIRKTMNKTPKDRNMLLKLETDLTNFINEPKHHFLRFPQMSSYDRMLVHRIAAFFGLDHNVDQTGKCVIVNKTSNTRIPEFCFRENIDAGEPKKKITGIMRRIGISSLDEHESHSKHLDKPLLLTAKARSFEDRIKDYEKARNKIFSSCDEPLEDDSSITCIIKKPTRPSSLTRSNNEGQPWSSTESSGYGTDSSVSKTRGVPKAKSFGGTVSYNHQVINKSHSLCAEPSVSPSLGQRHALATPPGSHSDSSPRSSSSGPIQSPGLGSQGNQVYWVASDIRSIPPGSIIINPNTGQPLSNPDGSVYHHTPGQPPPQSSPGYSSEMWTPSSESSATSELCRHLSMVNMNQHSVEASEPQGHRQTSYIVSQQQMPTPIQQSPVVQTQCFPGQQNMAGGVRYVYPVNYGVHSQIPNPVPGQSHGTIVAIDNQTFSQNSNQFPPQATSYQGYTAGTGVAAPNIEQYQTSNAYPPVMSDSYPTYPVQYSGNNKFPAPQNTVFYTPTSAPAPHMAPGGGYTTYGMGQHNSFNPSSQGNTTLNNQNVALHNLSQSQPFSLEGNQQQPTNPPFMFSTQFNSTTQPRAANPQLVQFSPAATTPPAVPIIRNMQINMPVAPQVSALQQQQQHIQGGHQLPKNCYQDQMPKLDGSGESNMFAGCNMVAGPPRPAASIMRPQAPITQDIRLVGQNPYCPPIQVPIPVQVISQQAQKVRTNSGLTSNKTQRLRNSKDSDSTEAQSGTTLEVCDLPGGMTQPEAEVWLKDLVNLGGKLHFIPRDNCEQVTIAGCKKIIAIFPSVSAASKAVEKCPYKLRYTSAEKSIGYHS